MRTSHIIAALTLASLPLLSACGPESDSPSPGPAGGDTTTQPDATGGTGSQSPTSAPTLTPELPIKDPATPDPKPDPKVAKSLFDPNSDRKDQQDVARRDNMKEVGLPVDDISTDAGQCEELIASSEGFFYGYSYECKDPLAVVRDLRRSMIVAGYSVSEEKKGDKVVIRGVKDLPEVVDDSRITITWGPEGQLGVEAAVANAAGLSRAV